MPRRLFQHDLELNERFEINVPDDDAEEIFAQCKAKDGEGQCPGRWAITVNGDGTIDKGVRNSLLSHARSHDGGFRKMRRIS